MFQIIKYAFGSVKGSVLLFIAYVILSLFFVGFTLAMPQLIGMFVDLLSDFATPEDARHLLMVIFTVWLLQIAMSYFHNIVSVKINAKVFFNMTSRIISHAKKIPVRYFDKESSAYFAQRINSDVSSLLHFFLNTLLTAVINALMIVFIIITMLQTNFAMTVATLSIIPVYFGIHFVLKKPIYTSTFSLKESRDIFFSSLNKQILKMKEIKMFSEQKETDDFLASKYSPVLNSAIKNAKIKQGYSISELLAKYFISIIVFVYSLNEVIVGRMTVGDFTVLNAYVGMLVGGISGFLTFGKTLSATNVSYSRTMEIMNSEAESDGNIVLDSVNTISIEDLSFSYDCERGATSLYKEFDFTFKAGNIYSLTGNNGIGKSTMFLLLLGLIKDFDGKIFYNNFNITEINMDSLRKKNLAVVTQDLTFLYEAVSDNISITELSKEKTQEYIHLLNFEKYFNETSESRINAEGFVSNVDVNTLSLGEKQKLSIIKALAKDSDVILLDEPSSGLDEESTRNLCSILEKEKQGKIIIIITHDMRLVELSDKQICIDKNL